MRTSRLLALCVVMVLGSPAIFAADAPPAADTPPTTRPADASISEFIAKLGDENFKTREAASDELHKIGHAALPALKDAAKSPDPEVQARAQALIKEIENPPKPKVADTQVDFGPIGNMRNANGQFRIVVNGQALNVNGGNVRMSKTVTVVNNRKEIEVTENQQKIHIVQDADGIKMSVTDTTDGKETTKTYEAKNAAELKEKQPEAFKIYEQTTKDDQGARIRVARPLRPGVRIAPGLINPNDFRIVLPPDVLRDLPPDVRKQFEIEPEDNADKPATRPAIP